MRSSSGCTSHNLHFNASLVGRHDATDYLFPRAADEQAFSINWQILKAILEQASYRLTRLEIGMRWPASPPPNAVTLFRWIERAVVDGLVLRDGEGVRGFPFRYWLPHDLRHRAPQ